MAKDAKERRANDASWIKLPDLWTAARWNGGESAKKAGLNARKRSLQDGYKSLAARCEAERGRSVSVPSVFHTGRGEDEARSGIRRSGLDRRPTTKATSSLTEPRRDGRSTDRCRAGLMAGADLAACGQVVSAKRRRREVEGSPRSCALSPLGRQAPPGRHVREPLISRRIRAPLLPSRPRFAATLSAAAQFATLQGYEDKIIDALEATRPSRADARWRRLRTKTPNAFIDGDRNGREDGARRRVEVVNEAIVLIAPRAARTRSDDPEPVSLCRRVYRKRLRVTYQLECAMDLMDKLREETGALSLSPRRQERGTRSTDPAASCENWIREWKHEFPASYHA